MSGQERQGKTRELHWGEKISVVSGVLLFAFMFLDWFGSGLYPGYPGLSGNAWQTLDLIPVVLVLAILVAVGVSRGNVGVELQVNGVIRPKNTVVFFAGLTAMAMILLRIFFPPSLADGISAQPRLGIFLSLVAACGIVFGANRAMRKEATLMKRQEAEHGHQAESTPEDGHLLDDGEMEKKSDDDPPQAGL
jgi:hypothetical protein